MPTLYVVAGKVFDTDGTTAKADVNVRVRNETTGDTSAAQTTNAQGEYAVNLASDSDFPNGWTVGDVVTAFVIYQQVEGSASHTTVAGSGGVTDLNITLSTVTISSLRYFTVGEFYRNFNLGPVDIPAEHIVTIGLGVEKQIDNELKTRFDNANTVTLEYHDANGPGHRDFFTQFTPIQSITTFQTTQSSEGNSSPTWDTLTETTHYLLDKETGRLAVIDDTKVPPVRRGGARVTYTYGYSSVPADAKRLAILMTGKFLMNSSVVKATISGRDNFNPQTLNALDSEINLIKSRYRKLSITTI